MMNLRNYLPPAAVSSSLVARMKGGLLFDENIWKMNLYTMLPFFVFSLTLCVCTAIAEKGSLIADGCF